MLAHLQTDAAAAAAGTHAPVISEAAAKALGIDMSGLLDSFTQLLAADKARGRIISRCLALLARTVAKMSRRAGQQSSAWAPALGAMAAHAKRLRAILTEKGKEACASDRRALELMEGEIGLQT